MAPILKMTLFFIMISGAAFAQGSYYSKTTQASAPITYTEFELKQTKDRKKREDIIEIWRDIAIEALPELRPRMRFYIHEVKHDDDSYDIVSMMYSPDVCGMQQCPLRVTSFKKGKPMTILDTFAIFAEGYKAYAIGPKTDTGHRKLFIAGTHYNTIYTYDVEKKSYIREDK